MTISETIQKAIEGGWEGLGKNKRKIQYALNHIELDEQRVVFSYGDYDQDDSYITFSEILLDPLFWQSLGKAMGWRDWFYSYYVVGSHRPEDEKMIEKRHKKYGYCLQCGYWQKVESFEDIPEKLKEVKGAWRQHPLPAPEYLYYWHQFSDYLAEGKDIESFFNQF